MGHPNLIISVALLLHVSCVINGSPELGGFIYKLCSSVKVDGDPNGVLSGIRERLVEQLLQRSSESKFYRSAVVPEQQVAVWGQFECRRDLSAEECHACVGSITRGGSSWCGSSLSGRVQLYGCHVQYEADGSEMEGADLTHAGCGEVDYSAGGASVQAALAAVESGVVDSPSGYCSADVGGVYALAQCAEGLTGCLCGDCVSKAAGIAAQTCAPSLSGHAYLDLCFVTFEFRPSNFNPPPGKRGGGIRSSGKLVAIAAGGIALVSIAIILLKRSFKKDDDDW